MTQNKIIVALEESNKWWKGAFEIEFKNRVVYEEIKTFLNTRQIIALTGLRRVGKTTIMLKIVKEHIKEFGAENILYFSFDDFNNSRIKEIITIYSRIMNKDLNKGNYLLLFDEIQKLDRWEEQIKRLYDNFKNTKIIISGSESLFIRKKSKESLAGRLFEFHIKPLSFREYLTFRGKEIANIELYKEDILREFNNFLFSGGFPEIINESREVSDKYIKEIVIEKIIYKDIPQIFPVKEPPILEGIFKIILLNPGQIINIDELSKEFGVIRQTVSNYLEYLEKSFLIKKLYNFSRNARKTQRKLKKYYPTIIVPEIVEKPELFGKVFESAMVLELDADFFWRDTYKNEVDIVKQIKETILPIEIKSSKIEDKPLKLFMKKFKVNNGIILTYDTKGTKKINGMEIDIIPFYEYLLNNNLL